MERKPIDVFDSEGKFTVEFKELVDNYIQEELAKVTTDGKLDYNKALIYIKEHMKESAAQERRNKVKEKKVSKRI